MFYPRGEEVAAARRRRRRDGLHPVDAFGLPLEDVRRATTRPGLVPALSRRRPRRRAAPSIARARKAGYSALVVTIDTPVAGLRERDLRNGMKELVTRNPLEMLPFIWQFARAGRAGSRGSSRDGGMMKFPERRAPGRGPMPYADVGSALEQSTVTWQDLRWIRDAWNGPIVVKGVHTRRRCAAGDRRRAPTRSSCRTTAAASSIACTATLRVLPEVVAAVNGQAEVLLDGGIRRGSDVVKALCLGARAVLIGRAYAYGLGAAGGAGVARAIEILRADRDAHDQAARLPLGDRAERVVHRRAGRVVGDARSGLGITDQGLGIARVGIREEIVSIE